MSFVCAVKSQQVVTIKESEICPLAAIGAKWHVVVWRACVACSDPRHGEVAVCGMVGPARNSLDAVYV